MWSGRAGLSTCSKQVKTKQILNLNNNNNNNNMFIDVLEVQKAYHKYRKNISQIQCANDSEIRLYVINNALMATQKN